MMNVVCYKADQIKSKHRKLNAKLTGISNDSCIAAASHDFKHFFSGCNIYFQKALDIDTLDLIFMNWKVVLRGC
jgi:hypothetical protein